MDNGSSQGSSQLGQDLAATLLLSKDENIKLECCKKHNIRKIQIRCLSELLQINTELRRSSDDVQKFSWATYFNADCTFSSYNFVDDDSNSLIAKLLSVKKHLLQRMTELDELLYEDSDAYKGYPIFVLLPHFSLTYT
jgi:hypothetical protein